MYIGNMGRGKVESHSTDDVDSEKRYDSKTSIAYSTHEKLCN